MRQRLRPMYTSQRLMEIYPVPHDHRRYGRGHGERVEETIRVGRTVPLLLPTVADLSCGNGVIARSLCESPVLGDLAPGYPIQGMIENTLPDLSPVELYICSETLEHVDNPDDLLAMIRNKCKYLLLSTPIDNWGDTNGEHYWAWSKEDVEEMLMSAGFSVVTFSSVDSRTYGEPYHYGIWLLT